MKRSNIGKARYLRKNQTDAERKLWSVLRNRGLSGIKFRRQFPMGNYILDFYSPDFKLGIEADGGQHYSEQGKQSDQLREKVLSELGVQVLRFSDRDILANCDGVCSAIQKAVEKRLPPHLNPLPDGEKK